MRVIAATLFAAFLLAACQTPCPAPNTGPVTTQFMCEDGSNLSVTFTFAPDFARVEEEGYTTLTLPARIAGSGYAYVGSGAELRQHGPETSWTRPGATETICHAVQAGAAAQTNGGLPRQAMTVGGSSRCYTSSMAMRWPRIGTSAS